jgi:type II secretory pathway component PulM
MSNKTTKIQQFTYKHKQKIEILGNELKIRLKPLNEYWLKLTNRERLLILTAVVAISITLIMLLISSSMDMLESLRVKAQNNKNNEKIALFLKRQYQKLNELPNISFVNLSIEKIKKDATQILDTPQADITLDDNTLRVNINSAKFSSSLLFLDQLRKSYGLFPLTLSITRLPEGGLVSVSATFSTEGKN